MNSHQHIYSARVEAYVKSRPGYPTELLAPLVTRCSLTPSSVVADIGSGTGLFSRLFLDYGCAVYGVEINAEMRLAAESILAGYRRFTSLAGRAEALPLPDASVDLIAVGQAFHWFEPSAARAEFRRILRPGSGGWVVIAGYHPVAQDTPFSRAYQAALARHMPPRTAAGPHPAQADPEEAVRQFFGGNPVYEQHFSHTQWDDFERVLGGALSASFAPLPGDPHYQPLLDDLRRAFEAHCPQGKAAAEFKFHLFYAQL